MSLPNGLVRYTLSRSWPPIIAPFEMVAKTPDQAWSKFCAQKFSGLKPDRSEWDISVSADQGMPDDDGPVRIDPASLDDVPDVSSEDVPATVLAVLETIVTRVEEFGEPTAEEMQSLLEYIWIVGRRAVDASQSWDEDTRWEDTRWDGNNHISLATGSQWNHETLYRSRKGRYYLVLNSQWQGSTRSADFLSREDAATWILAMGHELPDDLAELHRRDTD